MATIKRLLVANRGEIAIRIIRSARELGIEVITVYSVADKESRHSDMGDIKVSLGDGALCDTYLNIEKIISIAKEFKAGAIHPGYGFLAENASFAQSCKNAGIIFIGPTPEAIALMGNKLQAREFALKHNIPLIDGATGTPSELIKAASKLKYPIMIKAAAGGGGKGMRVVYNEKELAPSLESTSREAKSAFADGTVYLERYIENPRHIEVQILSDSKGNTLHLFERECTIQRRHQKIIEEAPSPTLTPVVRSQITKTAVKIAQAIPYLSAGTIEFIVDSAQNFFFLEMNTRIQVEHPVTEMITGVDIVKEQLAIAEGRAISFKQEDISIRGHALECRVYAEKPTENFRPAPGKMTYYKEAQGPWIRNDSAINRPVDIRPDFDPMISKVITWGKDREQATAKMLEALKNTIIHGIDTNIEYLMDVIRHERFIKNMLSTKFCEETKDELLKEKNIEPGMEVVAAAMLGASLSNNSRGQGGADMGTNAKKDFNIWEHIGAWRN